MCHFMLFLIRHVQNAPNNDLNLCSICVLRRSLITERDAAQSAGNTCCYEAMWVGMIIVKTVL